jgi:hypothetical protein
MPPGEFFLQDCAPLTPAGRHRSSLRVRNGKAVNGGRPCVVDPYQFSMRLIIFEFCRTLPVNVANPVQRPKWLIKAAGRRQKWIDQSQPLNLYIANPSG